MPRRKTCVMCSNFISRGNKRSVCPGGAIHQRLRQWSEALAAECTFDSEICNSCYMELYRAQLPTVATAQMIPAPGSPQPGPSWASTPPAIHVTSFRSPSFGSISPISPPGDPTVPAVIRYHRPSHSQSRCFLCGDVDGRTRVPDAAIRQAFLHLNVVIPQGARCCNWHLVPETGLFCSGGLFDTARCSQIPIESDTADQVAALPVSRPIGKVNFFDGLRPHDYDVYFGLTSDQMQEVFRSMNPSADLDTAGQAFGMLLVYLRMGISQDS